MERILERFHRDYYGQTTLHPAGLAAIIVLGILLLTLPRRYAVWPMIVMGCFVASAQRIVVFSLDFDLLRIMVLVGSLRLFVRGEWRGLRLNALDLALIAWTIAGTVTYTLLRGSVQAMLFKLGAAYDAVGMYFLFRCLIRSWDDIGTIVRGFVLASLPVAGAFAIEHATGRNLFAFLGGVPEITVVRDGRLRCQGAFSHPILAGCFWAALVPIIAAQWWQGGQGKVLALVGVLTSCAIVLLCASSTPVMAVLFAVLGACLYPLRFHMRWIRWGLLFTGVGLHLVMKAPVWQLIGRIRIVGGSTGWHRYLLIDRAIEHFDEWWLLGNISTVHWGIVDITNQYILEGLRGGLLTLVCFVVLIALGFRQIGMLWRNAGQEFRRTSIAWALGVALFVHVTSFLAVSYFGQIMMVWYLQLAIIGSLPLVGTRAAAVTFVSKQRHDARSGRQGTNPSAIAGNVRSTGGSPPFMPGLQR